jgi:bifunctional polynucleotide phosphatase/kinase
MDNRNENNRNDIKILNNNNGIWYKNDDILYFIHKNSTPSNRIASFDLDGTIIITKSGKKIPNEINDWKIISNNVNNILLKFYNNNYRIIIFSNQLGIEKNKITIYDLISKINNIITYINIPIDIFISIKNNNYRKPAIGMWEYMNKYLNNNIKIILKNDNSIYVGDAAGRIYNNNKKDFSCSDRKFALNIGINFYTPEQIFLNNQKIYKYDIGFDPNILYKNSYMQRYNIYNNDIYNNNIYNSIINYYSIGITNDIILFVGYPSSGKTTFVKRYLIPNKYIHINQDKLKTIQKCLSLFEYNINNNNNCIVIDNTNPSIEIRYKYIKIAKLYNRKIRCFYFNTPIKLCQHLNTYRSKIMSKYIPNIAYNIYNKKFIMPTIKEGFYEVINIDFIPLFDNKSNKDIFLQYT